MKKERLPALAGIILLVGGKPLIAWILKLNGFAPASSVLVPLLLFTLWALYAYAVYMYIRNERYYQRTGRKFGRDRAQYKRTFRDLVKFYETSEPHKLAMDPFPVCDWKDYTGLIFGKSDGHLVGVPSTTEGNIAVFGPPGSGKTAGIAIPNAMKFGGSVLVIDVKGDIYNYVRKHSKRKILRFAPDAPDALKISCHFDPLKGVKDMEETEKKLYMETMATILIPEEGRGENNYFSSRARKLFQGIAFLILDKTPEAGFPDIIHQILEGNVFDWVVEAINGNCRLAREQLASFYGNNEKNVAGAYDCLASALIHFSNPILDQLLSSKGGHCISSRDLDDGMDVYLQISQQNLDVYAPLFTLILQSFSTEFSKRPDSSTGVKNRPVLVIADELPALSFSYQLLNRNISTLRSKSCIFMLICQNLSQLDYKYEPTGEKAIVGNCNFQLILGCNDPASGQLFSDLFGQKKVMHRSNSSSSRLSSISVSESYERVFPPEYFGDLPARETEVLYFKGKYAEIQKLNCYR